MSSCDLKSLSPEQLKQVHIAEDRENFRNMFNREIPVCATIPGSLLTLPEPHGLFKFKGSICGSLRSHPNRLKPLRLPSDDTHRLSAKLAQSSPGRRAPTRGASDCENGLSISSVEGDGKVDELDDGSLWVVDDLDTVDTALCPRQKWFSATGKQLWTRMNPLR